MWAIKNGQFNIHIIISIDLDWRTLSLNVASLSQTQHGYETESNANGSCIQCCSCCIEAAVKN